MLKLNVTVKKFCKEQEMFDGCEILVHGIRVNSVEKSVLMPDTYLAHLSGGGIEWLEPEQLLTVLMENPIGPRA